MKHGVRGKYVARLCKGINLVLLEPEAAAAFSFVPPRPRALLGRE